MPVRQPISVGGTRGVELRHVGPIEAVYPPLGRTALPITQYTVLAQTNMVSRPLPRADTPGDPNYQQGTTNFRLADAGDGQIAFPNKTSSDGIPWVERFDGKGHLQWIEVYSDNELDSVFCIVQRNRTRPSVEISGGDGFWMTKKAYERDWIVVMAPRDVIERATQLWTALVADDFSSGALGLWVPTVSGGGSYSIAPNGGLVLRTAGIGYVQIVRNVAVSATSTWTSSVTLSSLNIGGDIPSFNLEILESSAHGYTLQSTIAAGVEFSSDGNLIAQVSVAPSAIVSLSIESDGRWVWAFVNGALIGGCSRSQPSTTSIQTTLLFDAVTGGGGSSAFVSNVQTEAMTAFLQRGSDKGDWVLPGDPSTYPTGGLHGRYFNDLDLQSDPQRLAKIHHPSRSQVYGLSTTLEYANQQDAQLNGQANPLPGAAASNWSAIWFGSIYLKMSAGDYLFAIQTGVGAANTAIRVWVGQTQLGSEIVAGQWAWQNQATYAFSVKSTILAGTLSDGSKQARDGWYPIIIEYAVDAAAAGAPQLTLTSSPTAYTDPGGTPIAAGAQSTVVPSTSLSPLGCVDQRYQGVSHFDMVQQTLQAYDYQATCIPQRLESGLFPGVLAPRIREGFDTAEVVRPDDDPRAKAILNYGALDDTTDFASSMSGNGAGFQSGNTGQLQARVYDPATLMASLFDAQAWQDFSDASFRSLLEALLNSDLGLRLEPWEVITADPRARMEREYLYPLSGAVAKMRWMPGWGLFVRARDIGVWDTIPRQLLTVQRTFTPRAVSGTSVVWAARPRTPGRTLKRQLYSATRWQRNYQRTAVSLQGALVASTIAASTLDSQSSAIAMQPSDQLVSFEVRLVQNSASQPMVLYINGNAVGSLGPWSTVPAIIPVGSAEVSAANTVVIQFENTGALSSNVSYQALATVMR